MFGLLKGIVAILYECVLNRGPFTYYSSSSSRLDSASPLPQRGTATAPNNLFSGCLKPMRASVFDAFHALGNDFLDSDSPLLIQSSSSYVSTAIFEIFPLRGMSDGGFRLSTDIWLAFFCSVLLTISRLFISGAEMYLSIPAYFFVELLSPVWCGFPLFDRLFSYTFLWTILSVRAAVLIC